MGRFLLLAACLISLSVMAEPQEPFIPGTVNCQGLIKYFQTSDGSATEEYIDAVEFVLRDYKSELTGFVAAGVFSPEGYRLIGPDYKVDFDTVFEVPLTDLSLDEKATRLRTHSPTLAGLTVYYIGTLSFVCPVAIAFRKNTGETSTGIASPTKTAPSTKNQTALPQSTIPKPTR